MFFSIPSDNVAIRNGGVLRPIYGLPAILRKSVTTVIHITVWSICRFGPHNRIRAKLGASNPVGRDFKSPPEIQSQTRPDSIRRRLHWSREKSYYISDERFREEKNKRKSAIPNREQFRRTYADWKLCKRIASNGLLHRKLPRANREKKSCADRETSLPETGGFFFTFSKR